MEIENNRINAKNEWRCMRIKVLDFKDCRHDIESEAIKYLLGVKFGISVRASMIA